MRRATSKAVSIPRSSCFSLTYCQHENRTFRPLTTTKQPEEVAKQNEGIAKPKTEKTPLDDPHDQVEATPIPKKKKKTTAELDEELRQKMSGMAGDGGEPGVEYEDGRPADMKRSVKNNMFRYI